MEMWLTVPSDPRYEVSDRGRVRNAKTKRVRRIFLSPQGYPTVGIAVGGKVTTAKVHRMVCEAFHGPPPKPGMDVCHGDGSRDNNAPGNLRWGTRTENMADMLRHFGIAPRVKVIPKRARTVLSDGDVEIIRAAPRKWGAARVLADHYGVSLQYIYNIRASTNLRSTPQKR